MYSWGLALEGALGYELTNLEACQLAPKLISIPTTFHKLFIGAQNSALVTTEGIVYMCGQNQFQSCHQSRSLQNVATVSKVDLIEEVVSEVSFSNLSYTLVLTASGRVFEMGFSSAHDCAHSDSLGLTHFENSPRLKKFIRPIEHLDSKIIVKIISGRLSVALSSENEVLVWDCLKAKEMTMINLESIGISRLISTFSSEDRSILHFHHVDAGDRHYLTSTKTKQISDSKTSQCL